MKQHIKVCQEFPNTVTKIREAIQEEWDNLVPADWNKFIDSMPEGLCS